MSARHAFGQTQRSDVHSVPLPFLALSAAPPASPCASPSIQRCARVAETLPVLQHDSNHHEDVLKVDADEDELGGDNADDALRYLSPPQSATITVRKLTGL